MQKVRIILSMLLTTATVVLGVSGCSPKEEILSPNTPVKITVWDYYNGAQLDSFNDLVSDFNKTVGKEKGIIVEAASQGSVDELQKNVLDSMNGVAGAEKTPNIFSAYADTAYPMYKMDKLVNLKDYFSDNELNEYVSGYINEGYLEGSDQLSILPIAKSTEILFVNATDWKKFSDATGADISELATYEGLTDIAEKYYNWTDSLTDEPNDGKAFFGRDAMANYFIVGIKQHGQDIFEVQDNGKVKLNFDKKLVRKLWDNYYVPYIKGYCTLSGRFGSDDVKSGTTIAFIGSTSGASFYPNKVSISDTESYPIKSTILPCPIFEGQQEVSVQQGAGMVVTKSTKKEETASAEFLKWFTENDQNLKFTTASGYLPVKKTANDKEVIKKYINQDDAILTKTVNIGIDTVNTSELYTANVFENANSARNTLTYGLSDLARQDRETVQKQINEGISAEKAMADYLSDDYFEKWYSGIKTELENYLK